MIRIEKVHMISDEELEKQFETNKENGLSSKQVIERLVTYGKNEIERQKSENLFIIFLKQFHQPLVYILLIAALITFVMKEKTDALVIFGVVIINAIIGFIQEAKAVRAIEALSKTMESDATVIRDNRKLKVNGKDLVPGDIVFIQSGDKVPADIRLFKVRQLRIQEAALTGESVAAEKIGTLLAEDVVLGDKRNMAFASTFVTFGQGFGIVTHTGGNTEIGKISKLIKETISLETPLIKKISKFSHTLLYIIGGMAALTFILGIIRGEHWLEMFKAAIALAVGAIPEGLPAALAATLAIGVSRMAKRNAIIRKLPVVETLGSATVICSDKTGTLTENQMTVKKIWTSNAEYEVTGQGYNFNGSITLDGNKINVNNDKMLFECLRCGVFCNDSSIELVENDLKIQGDPTEISLLISFEKTGLDSKEIIVENKRLDVLPFESERQYMAVLTQMENGENRIYIKGAIEKILAICEDISPVIHDAYEKIAAEGLRVLSFAYKTVESEKILEEDLLNGFTFLGLQGMIDPPRIEAISAIRKCHEAGIVVKMITGDHAVTAAAIAKQLGITGKNGQKAVTGAELEKLGGSELIDVAVNNNVFARVTPEQKLRLVEALQSEKNVVAMTGDGVNDAPALKRADIGIAMGITGTEVAKDSADMILTDDNFATIEAAVEEGRGVFDNITKFITWTLPTNIGEGLVILLAVFLGINLPITPTQILWINMTTAVFLGLMLAFEPKEPGLMLRKPRKFDQPILTPKLLIKIFLVSLILLTASFMLFEFELQGGASIEQARTVAVTVFIVVEAAYLFNSRSLNAGILKIGLFSNKFIFIGIATMAILQWAFIYLPFMNKSFGTSPFPISTWIKILACGVITFIIMEIEKIIIKKTRFEE
jgi:cation-transporting ATPase F